MKSYNKWDLRVQKTYKLLHTSLITLLEKQSFDEITVQAICDEKQWCTEQHFMPILKTNIICYPHA
ncbi:hypothetical protein ACLFLH_01120 [Mammaliicoccus sciuri]|uniref:hypothetical protein n=1 Tax=Mammaliicoccus sciuri TaxID=1296 RepID=UPI0039796297